MSGVSGGEGSRTRPPVVCFRVDASLTIGSGHLMRSLTLADLLRSRGLEVLFICRKLEGNLCSLISSRGFEVHRLPAPSRPFLPGPDEPVHAPWLEVSWRVDAEESCSLLSSLDTRPSWLVVDHYALDLRWERALRPYAGRIMVIDDLADRAHDCELLLDQNLCSGMDERYLGLVPSSCRQLLGPRHALLRPEFFEERKRLRKRDGRVRRVLVFFGGSDLSNETSKALAALRLLGREEVQVVEIVVGGANPHRAEIELICAGMKNCFYHCQVENMARLMAGADLALGAGGTATWERCFLGLPTLTLVLADNQSAGAAAVAAAGAAFNLGKAAEVTAEALAEALRDAMADPERLRAMGEKGMALFGPVPEQGNSELLQALLEDFDVAS